MAAADDALDSVSSHTIDILRVAAGMRSAVIARLIDLEGELSSALSRADDLSANKYAKLNALLKQTTAQIIDAYSQIDGFTKDDLKQLATLEGKQAVKIVNGTIGADVVSVALSPKQLEAIVDAPIIFGNSSSQWWEAQAEDLRAKFAAQMQQGLLLGEGIDELARRVRGTKAAGYADGIMDKKKREADALVRSSVISTANEARLRTYAEMSDIVKGIQWVATLDNRTTPICRALDGKIWRLPDFEPVGHDKKYPGPTAHFNCRSTHVPVLRSWEELSGKKLPSIGQDELQARLEEKLAARGWSPEKIAQAKANTRASMDGQEAKATTFDDWMGSKGPAAVDQLLGPGRAKLWKEGKVTVSDLTKQNNRPLTLAQLANKIERGIPAPETLGQDFLPLPAKPKAARPAPEPAPPPEPELSPEDAAAKQKLADAAATKLHQKLVGEITAANPDASPAVQWAVVEAMIRIREIAAVLNDAAAEKVAAGTMPAKVKKTLDSLASDDPARDAWEDKLQIAKMKKREILKSALPDADLEEIAVALARDGMIANKGLKSLWAVVSKDEAAQVQTRVAELKAEKASAAAPPSPEAIAAAAVTTLPAVLPPTPPRKKPVSLSVKGEIPESIRPALEYAFNAMARAHDDGELPKIEVTDKRSTGIRKSDRGAYVREGWKSILVFLDPEAKHREWTGVHEFGHFMHHQVLGDDPEWSDGRGKASTEAAKLKKVLESTTEVKELKKAAKAQKSVVVADWKYLADYREIFARAYGQWLATKLRDPLLLEGMEADRRSIHGKSSQWTDESFVPIAAAFDALFAAKGWL